jgi:hypothetical protein
MVQPGDRNECPTRVPGHDFLDGEQRAADDETGRFEDASERGRVAGIEIAAALARSLDHEIDVFGAMERLELVTLGDPRLDDAQ